MISRVVYTIFLAILLGALVYFGSIQLSIKGTQLPALGSFFSPFTGFWQNAESANHFEDIDLSHPSLQGEVQVVFDDRLVPHIFAGSDEDMAFAQGYVQAMLRLWQMDMSMRDICGRLAEVVGERGLERDIQTRREGFGWAIDRALATYSNDEASMAILQAFTDGVNLRISQLGPAQYPLEYKLLGFAPEEWTLRHSVALSKSMSRVLTMKNNDVENTLLREAIGPEIFDFLYPTHMKGAMPVHAGPWKNIDTDSVTPDRPTAFYNSDIGSYYKYNEDENMASNNWAISGEKSATGNPILCNDPHLKLTLPSVWFESHLVTPEMNVYGVSLLGLPSIIIGFNENIAWGITNGGIDVLDWLEVTWKDESKEEYLLDDDWVKAEYRTEIIQVKGQADHKEKVPYTHWGPVAVENNENGLDLAMKWTGHDAIRDDELLVFVKLAKASNLSEYEEALKNFPSPIQNLVFASKDGDIALRSQGYWPLRGDMQGRFISDGSSGKSSWENYIPFEYIPASVNPDKGYVSSANQESTDLTYPFIYFGSFENYRGRILHNYLNKDKKFGIDDMVAIQLSNYSLHAEEALPTLLKLIDRGQLNEKQIAALDQLIAWDYIYDANSFEAALFNSWIYNLPDLIYDEISQDDPEVENAPDLWVTVELITNHPDHSILDIKSTEETEHAQEIIQMAFEKGWEELSAIQSDVTGLAWNEVLQPKVAHLASIEAFARAVPVGGSKKSLNAMSATHGPSWRQIIELTPTGPKALGVYPGGQSGNPGSRYYDDSVETWSKGEYNNLTLYKNPEEIIESIFMIQMNEKQ